MYSPFTLGLKYFNYLLRAKNGKGHGTHSPFVFDFITRVLNDKARYDCYAGIETARQQFLADGSVIEVEDYGAGSRNGLTRQRKISAIAASSLKPKKFGQLLFRMAKYYGAHRMLELGTSLGITTSYLAASNKGAAVYTMEGAPAIAAVAQNQFSRAGLNNIQLITGNFDHSLEDALGKLKTVDMVYIDGNHLKAPTLRYFQQLLPFVHNDTILVFDDIHWSSQMEEAWAEIKQDVRVRLTIDLFFVGLVFFKKEFKERQHFTIRF